MEIYGLFKFLYIIAGNLDADLEIISVLVEVHHFGRKLLDLIVIVGTKFESTKLMVGCFSFCKIF